MTSPATISEPLLMHNTMRIAEGHLDEFKHAIRQSVQFVEQHGPQLMVQVFIDDEAMLAHSFQLYADSAAIRRHWQLSEHVIDEVMKHCTIDRFTMYGEPDQAVIRGLHDALDDQVPLQILARHTGYFRTR